MRRRVPRGDEPSANRTESLSDTGMCTAAWLGGWPVAPAWTRGAGSRQPVGHSGAACSCARYAARCGRALRPSRLRSRERASQEGLSWLGLPGARVFHLSAVSVYGSSDGTGFPWLWPGGSYRRARLVPGVSRRSGFGLSQSIALWRLSGEWYAPSRYGSVDAGAAVAPVRFVPGDCPDVRLVILATGKVRWLLALLAGAPFIKRA